MWAEGTIPPLPRWHPSPLLYGGEALRYFGLTGTGLGQNQQAPGLCSSKLVSTQGWLLSEEAS